MRDAISKHRPGKDRKVVKVQMQVLFKARCELKAEYDGNDEIPEEYLTKDEEEQT